MLEIVVSDLEYYDESGNDGEGRFETLKGGTLLLEHSLASLSKWESVYEKPFLENDSLTNDEASFYIECMCIGDNPRADLIPFLSIEQNNAIQQYITRKHTATWFNEVQFNSSANPNKKKVITSEVIYSWMINYGIPFECERWNLNRLITLIRVCQADQQAEKLNSRDSIAHMKALNEQRRAKYRSGG